MLIDFFVHPEHAKLSSFNLSEQYFDYLKDIEEKIETSKNPILIKSLNEGDLDKQFSLERILDSRSFSMCGEYIFHYGQVHPKDWVKFKDLVKFGTNFRIHGSFMGECTEGFAVQLFAYLKRKEHWYNWFGTGSLNDRYKIQNKLRMYHEIKGDFKKSNIKFGTVLEPPKKILIRKPSFLSLCLARPQGNITYQLIDERTKIYSL